MLIPVELSFTAMAALLAYLIAAFSAVLLFRAAHGWQVKGLSVLIAVIPTCEAVRVLRDIGVWFTFGSSALSEMAELAVAALFLVSVLVLKRECVGTENAEARLCLAEAAAGWNTASPLRPSGHASQTRTGIKGPHRKVGNLVTPSSPKSAADIESTSDSEASAAFAAEITSSADATGSAEAVASDDRRGEPRYPSNSRVWIVVHDPGRVGELLAEVIDVSRSGMRLLVPWELATGTKLETRFGDTQYRGEIRWCRASECVNGNGKRFQIGVELTQQSDR